MYLDGGMGGGGWLLTSFFSIIYILGLVCYKHTIHGVSECVCFLLLPQAINAELIPFLLGLLERDLVECDKPSATKAVIAESLKLMAKDLANGEKVGGATCGGWGYLWWVGLPVMGGATGGGWGCMWWVGLPAVGGATCGGRGYLWWVGLPVVGGATCGGWGYLW